MEKLKQDLKSYYFLIIGIVLWLGLFYFLFHELCPFKVFLGIECPGCGLTHATIYMITGRFREAFEANWTVFFWWLFIILFFIDRYIKKIKIKPVPYILIFVGVITIIRYIYRIIQFFFA